jgi:hypothetical protein
MRCFGCGMAVELRSGERVGFRDACPGCGRDLHVCRNCAHHDPSAYNECRESSAERVGDRERANRCDYFAPGGDSARPGAAPGAGRSALDALFKSGPKKRP